MKKLFILSILLISTPCFALVSFQTTGSGGIFRDRKQEIHTPASFTWTFNHSTDKEIETNTDLGFNNNLVLGSWNFYLYQAFISVPFSKGFKESPFRKSRVQLGRQLLTEGFEMSSIDGAILPIYLNSRTSLWLVGGAYSAIDDPKTDFKSQIYGGSLRTEVAGFQPKAGYIFKNSDQTHLHLGHASLSRTFSELGWMPTAVVKGQWKLDTGVIDQSLAGLQLFPAEPLLLSFDFSRRQPTALDAGTPSEIFKLFSVSSVDTYAGSLTWLIHDGLRAETKIQHYTFDSRAGGEKGNQQDLSVTWDLGFDRLTPGITHLTSYGGNVVQGSLGYKRFLNSHTEVRTEVDAARINKINGISGYAYHGRAGLGFKLVSRFFALAMGELERNHLYDFNAKGTLYVSYFFY